MSGSKTIRADLIARLDALIREGPAAGQTRGGQSDYWVIDKVRAQSWLTSAVHVIKSIAPSASTFVQESEKLLSKETEHDGIAASCVRKILGILQSLKNEVDAGLLQRLEDVAFATAFDDFLDHAADIYKRGMINEAAVLAAVVLEDTMKRIAQKHSVPSSGRTLDPLIDALVKAGVFTSLQAKRLKVYAGVRNSALHADWANVDKTAVGETITGVKELLTNHL